MTQSTFIMDFSMRKGTEGGKESACVHTCNMLHADKLKTLRKTPVDFLMYINNGILITVCWRPAGNKSQLGEVVYTGCLETQSYRRRWCMA